ncbi:hypothetical protein LZ31DRAFT_386840 [Colletotrichum somersetense]|nr:hypothetical protein LZ31DRAFT_386840 [Colletotrichum somersetense]
MARLKHFSRASVTQSPEAEFPSSTNTNTTTTTTALPRGAEIPIYHHSSHHWARCECLTRDLHRRQSRFDTGGSFVFFFSSSYPVLSRGGAAMCSVRGPDSSCLNSSPARSLSRSLALSLSLSLSPSLPLPLSPPLSLFHRAPCQKDDLCLFGQLRPTIPK